ncbi:sphingosine 1-phosphate lyase putative (SPL) [Leptomonas seymouri]|uniref:sphinganine-1-phosphate aldolase n=1 Tax=Leptomonas seymouri TaxID=5684 RepID=A0A0N1IBN8_LEPSE|nr:sphingosine 1-phosphate lyase putative (SPL) [Leptomonas seymouri]|eukprot:KPI90201.1 sphingosine 1-phosphate lyase putative (SPL) [Leptomonas seymouri]
MGNEKMTTLSDFVNEKLKDRTPTQIIVLTIGAAAATRVALDCFGDGQMVKRTKQAVWRGIRCFANPFISIQVKKATKDLKMPSTDGEFKALVLPKKSRSEAEVLELVRRLHADLDLSYEDGGFSGTVYHGGRTHTNFINDVMAIFQWSNPLHSDIFGATRKMEAEIVSMVLHMFNGHLLEDAGGAVTSGGTESIMMALKTYRDWARDTRGIERPSIIVPITIHPAFDKGAEYFNISLVKVPVVAATGRVDPVEMEKYIRYDTVALAASAPNFPHGVIDPIEEIAEVAFKHNIGFHVDCCLGGFIMPFLAKTGRNAPVVDFRNRGVTSISCDTHKYGYSPKGTSTVLYRTKDLRSYQFCCIAEWPGGMYCSPAVSGSKPGNVIAGTWAAMVRMGEQGYVECCDKILHTRETITTALAKLPYIHIIGEPITSVFAFNSNTIDIFQLGDGLKKRGWVLNNLQFPSGLQFSVTMLQTQDGIAERFIKDVKEVGDALYEERKRLLAEGKRPPVGATSATLYGTAQRIPDRTIVKDILREFLNTYYTA